jgi:predicted nucleic acid-binding protein
MAGNARYTAILDACVLYSIATTDALLSLATAGLFGAKWSSKIEEEWMLALQQRRPDLKDKLGVRRDAMRDAVPDWQVLDEAWSPLVESLSLPDPDDRHVLAAALAGHADCIVTANVRDFPQTAVERYGIEIVHPDRFIVNQWDLEPIVAISSFKRMRARRKRPQSSVDEFAMVLEQNELPMTAQRIREAGDLI